MVTKSRNYNQAGKYIRNTYDPSGLLVLHEEIPASYQNITFNQTSTAGARPDPLVPNAYHINCQTINANQSSGKYVYGNGAVLEGTGPILHPGSNGVTLLPSYDYSTLYNKALSKLTDKVRGNLDLSIDLAEYRKTLKMLKLSNEAMDYTKTFVNRYGIPKVLSKAWLTYQYGVRPLLGSIFGVADEMLRDVLGNSQHYFVRESEMFVPTSVVYSHMLAGTLSMKVASSSIKKSVTIGMDIRTDQFDLARWSSLNPVSIAWELTPFSFVADWFLNVGGYLRNMETYCLYANKFRSGYTTYLSAGTALATFSQNTVLPADPVISVYGTLTVKHVDINRVPLSSYPAPTLPQLKVELGASRLISAASLLAQFLNGRKQRHLDASLPTVVWDR